MTCDNLQGHNMSCKVTFMKNTFSKSVFEPGTSAKDPNNSNTYVMKLLFKTALIKQEPKFILRSQSYIYDTLYLRSRKRQALSCNYSQLQLLHIVCFPADVKKILNFES